MNSLGEMIRDAGYEPCSLCDVWQPGDDLLMVVVDEPGTRQPVCPECLATMERVA